MAEETQVLSIQDRIKALKLAQAGHGADKPSPFLNPSSQPTGFPLQPASPRPNSIKSPSFNSNGVSVPTASPVDNGLAPPETPQKPPRPVSRDSATEQKPRLPPRLPARQNSAQQVPSLPPRRPSGESIRSDTSRSTSTSTGRSTNSSTGPGLRAPPWGAELPALPQRPEKKPAPPTRPKLTPRSSSASLSAPQPKLPPRRNSNQSVSTESSESRPAPRLPSRPNCERSGATQETSNSLPTKRLPPPIPSGTALEKIQQAGFGSIIKKNRDHDVNGAGQVPTRRGLSSAPPPIPVSSRPDISKIQATKPKVAAPNSPSPIPGPKQTSGCLKCRDFSGPDNHAALYPRSSVPNGDLRWLARELTAPFPSPTDKARAIFTWLHHNISYDVDVFFNKVNKPCTADSAFISGLAVCQGYAVLFESLATEAGLEAKVISGHGKGYGYTKVGPGASLPPKSATGHAWNVVRIDHGQWKLIDPCWGAGVVNGPGQPYSKLFNPRMFTDSNDEFGLRHFPQDRNHFYRDDGRPEISWEEYILGNPNSPLCAEMPHTYTETQKHDIGERSFRPAAKQISISQPEPIRFQFNLVCEHWTLEHHSRKKPGFFLLTTYGADGQNKERLPFTHFRGSGPNGGGDVWYVDVPDPRVLGRPGQRTQLVVLTQFGDMQDTRGLTMEEYRRQEGRVGMNCSFVAEWELVA